MRRQTAGGAHLQAFVLVGPGALRQLQQRRRDLRGSSLGVLRRADQAVCKETGRERVRFRG
jgi:hypothetical protein